MPPLALVARRLYAYVCLFPTVGILAVPNGDAVPPPDLPADAPITQVINPVKVNFLEPFRNDFNIAVADDCLHNLFQAVLFPFPRYDWLINIYKPLKSNLWLNDSLTAIIQGDTMRVFLVNLYQQPLVFQLFDDFRPSFSNRHTCELVGNRQKFPVKIYYLFFVQPVAFGDVEVNLAMPRGDCHNTGAKLGINRL